MGSELALNASMKCWECTNCHQLYNAIWRPVKGDKVVEPPKAYNWAADKPTYRYCPMCGAEFKKEKNG